MAEENHSGITVLSSMNISVTRREVAAALGGNRAAPNPGILERGDAVLDTAKSIWNPRAVYRWLEILNISGEKVLFRVPGKEVPLSLNTGFSTRFLRGAGRALFAVYTIGGELEKEGSRQSGAGKFLDSYIYDIIGLLALDKAGDKVRAVAEEEARKNGWGIGPFLSPGSVHGWELKDQKNLCSVLPLDPLGLSIGDDAVLTPFKSVSCLLAVGPEYTAQKAGSTCEVCSKAEDCRIRLENSAA